MKQQVETQTDVGTAGPYAEMKRRYDRYVDGYRAADGELPPMMRLKYEHTARVVANAEAIADAERFAPLAREAARVAALLHDTGRYEQLRRFNTFKDSESVDHAVFSHDVVRDGGWLDAVDFGPAPAGTDPKAAVFAAVLYHNRRDVPEGLDALTFCLSHVVRDADKLDIFRVLEDRVQQTDWRADTRAFWNLRIDLPPNPVVLANIRARQPVDYQSILSLADFVLIQIGWMISGLHFATARRLCAARGHLAFRRQFLREIGAGPEADALCDLAASATV